MEDAIQENRWRDNAIALTSRYLKDGVPDRAATRDLPNGVDVPIAGFEGKKIYVWIEAVAGYLTASREWAKKHNEKIEDFWNKETTSYYIHGKDNFPFHSIIWPSILMGIDNPALPTHIVSNEYLTLEKRKISTSQNWAVWVPNMLERYDADSIRYFLTINAPENRDTDFSWREFIYSHNSELLGAYGNFVNRTLKFIEKSYAGTSPKGEIELEIEVSVNELYKEVGSLIREGHFKKSLEQIFEFVRYANKYFDKQKPWIQVKENITACNDTIVSCVYIIANLTQLLNPFLPISSEKVKKMLGLQELRWEPVENLSVNLHEIKPLFERINVKRIEEELERLNKETL